MKLKLRFTFIIALLFFMNAVYSGEVLQTSIIPRDASVDFGEHPGSIADAIVIFESTSDLALHEASKEERILLGKIISQERAIVLPGTITHLSNAIISPLRKGEQVKLFLKNTQMEVDTTS